MESGSRDAQPGCLTGVLSQKVVLAVDCCPVSPCNSSLNQTIFGCHSSLSKTISDELEFFLI